MKTSNKTPYEIRLELLQLAQDVLSKQHYARALGRAADRKDFPVATAPTTEEIIVEAEKMNNFISKANPNH
jgi:ActR/RegA family two-component response regulator